MAFLYGDSSPFPMEENFLSTLVDLTEACVALLRVDEDLEEARGLADEAKASAGRSLVKLEAVAATLVKGLEPHIGDPESQAAAQVAVRVMQAARAVLETARADNSVVRDAALREIEASVASGRAGIARAVEAFLAHHDLPGTIWQLRWRAGAVGLKDAAAPQAQVKIVLPCGVEAILELAIPLTHIWSKAVRASELEREVVIRMPVAGGWLRRGNDRTRRAERLDRWFITEVDIGPEKSSFVLRRGLKGPSDGLEIVMKADDQESPTARRMDAGGISHGGSVVLDPASVVAVKRLWSRIKVTIDELRANRRRLVQGTLDGIPLRDLVRPARLAEKLIDLVAPTVRELGRRSSSTSELVLKRDLGNGRREELFMLRADLTRMYRELSAGRRALFDGFGLGDGTRDGVAAGAIDEQRRGGGRATVASVVSVVAELGDDEVTFVNDDQLADTKERRAQA